MSGRLFFFLAGGARLTGSLARLREEEEKKKKKEIRYSYTSP